MEKIKFAIIKTSNEEFLKFKTFSSIEQILNFQKQNKHALIIHDFYVDKNGDYIDCPTLEIYDDYRE